MNQKSESFHRILVRMPNWLGDAVMATPILHDLKNHFPSSSITAMCQGVIGDLLIHNPFVDSVFRFKKTSSWVHRPNPPNIILPIAKGDYDLGILLTNSFSSAYWFWRGGVKTRIGFDINFRRFFLNRPIKFSQQLKTRHQVEVYKELLVPLGIQVSQTLPEIFLTDDEKKEGNQRINSFRLVPGQKVIGISPGAAFGTAKCWPKKSFQELIDKILNETPHLIICFGDQSGSQSVYEIAKGKGERVVNLAGKTSIRELLALINGCDVFLANDSGPMHMAAALGVPLLALFGSTNPLKTSPYKTGTIIYKQVPCSPCYKRVCPIDFRCMETISVGEVFSKLVACL